MQEISESSQNRVRIGYVPYLHACMTPCKKKLTAVHADSSGARVALGEAGCQDADCGYAAWRVMADGMVSISRDRENTCPSRFRCIATHEIVTFVALPFLLKIGPDIADTRKRFSRRMGLQDAPTKLRRANLHVIVLYADRWLEGRLCLPSPFTPRLAYEVWSR